MLITPSLRSPETLLPPSRLQPPRQISHRIRPTPHLVNPLDIVADKLPQELSHLVLLVLLSVNHFCPRTNTGLNTARPDAHPDLEADLHLRLQAWQKHTWANGDALVTQDDFVGDVAVGEAADALGYCERSGPSVPD